MMLPSCRCCQPALYGGKWLLLQVLKAFMAAFREFANPYTGVVDVSQLPEIAKSTQFEDATNLAGLLQVCSTHSAAAEVEWWCVAAIVECCSGGGAAAAVPLLL